MPYELTAEQLRRRFDPSRFTFKSTADAPDLDGIIGQDRATKAIEFGMEMPYPGYNVFATGPTGAGKTSIITRFLEDKAAARPVPPDWGYAHNFAIPIAHCAAVAPGRRCQAARTGERAARTGGRRAGQDVRQRPVRREPQRARPRARSNASEQFRELDASVRQQGFVLNRKDEGFILTPVKDGEPLTQEQFEALPEAERDALNEKGQALQEHWSVPCARCKSSKKRRATGWPTWTGRLRHPFSATLRPAGPGIRGLALGLGLSGRHARPHCGQHP